MSACYDCPKYGNPTITGPRRAMCCMEMKQQEPSLEVQLERLEYRAREAEREASQTATNRAARRRAAKLARKGSTP